MLAILVVIALAGSVRIVPPGRAGIVERLGRFSRTLQPGVSIIVPFVDKVRHTVDLQEQVVSFPPQPALTKDDLVVSIGTVIHLEVTDPVAATYEIANYVHAIEQLTTTTLRNIVGGMDLERTRASREQITITLRGVLDDATGNGASGSPTWS
ncbi:SPFH domain-containing protein [Actinopolymorpha sp. NPDC004070]|uniref:SPFH domain-containing protein n=1 Tax=Actinopolymorpha sp. NPDC004070 TaxID=3154548 RepID=UPI0033B35ABF